MSDDARRWDTPQLAVRSLSWLLVYFEERYGEARLEALWADEGLPLSLAYLRDLNNFVSLEFLELLLETLSRASGDPDFITHAGRVIATPRALGFAYYFLRALGTPLLAYRKTIELGSTYNHVGAFTVEDSSPTSMTLRYRSEVPERSRLACRGRQANFAAFPLIWSLPPAEVRELQCQVEGADSCRYHLTWKDPAPRAWLRFAGAAAGALAGALLWPPALHGALVLGLGGFFVGAWVDARRLADQRGRLLEEQTQAMGQSIRELERRAQEVHTANLELDARVADRTRALAEALARLEQLDSLKSELFANVSHELRTPLTLIVTPVEERLSREPHGPGAELLRDVRHQALRLLRLIDDILDLSRIEAGHLRLEVVPVDLARLARDVGEAFRPIAEARGLTLEVRGGDAHNGVFGDLHRLEMVVNNLVANALKYTLAGGHVTLLVGGDDEVARLSVIDTGVGISKEDLAHVFDRFFQVPEGHGRGQRGFGIGLALASNLVQLHGGRIEAQSVPGEGSTFTVALPRGEGHFASDVVERRRVQSRVPERRRESDAAASIVTPLPAPEPVGEEPEPVVMEEGRRPQVLVVEDNAELAALLARTLQPIADVEVRGDGVEGLAAAKERRPDLILTDVMMPGMNGLELTQALKADAQLKRVPVIVVTARAGPESALDGFVGGADDFVEKPFHPRVLRARVTAALRNRAMALGLVNASRLAAVGTLAAGVGHEVRNPVNAVLNGVRVLKQRAGVPEELRPMLDVIEDGARRIEVISSALLAHASPGDRGGRRIVSPVVGLRATLALLAHRLADVTVREAFDESLRVVAPAVELNQVLLNLLDNALSVGARTLWLGVEARGAAVAVTVGDDGPGITAEVAERLFTPFFTTRPSDGGTGLGLYLSRQLAGRWGGQLTHAPRDGGGTVFTLTLPGETL